jgi:hypothetical protein
MFVYTAIRVCPPSNNVRGKDPRGRLALSTTSRAPGCLIPIGYIEQLSKLDFILYTRSICWKQFFKLRCIL